MRKPYQYLSKPRLVRLLAIVSQGVSVTIASDLVGVSRSAIHKHARIDPGFRVKLERARAGQPISCPHCGEAVV